MEHKDVIAEIMHEPVNGYKRISEKVLPEMENYCRDYKKFLDEAKTERECVKKCIELAEDAGFKEFKRGSELKPGDKVYRNNRGKMLMLAVIGQKSMEDGVQITAAHIDSPRLDLKPMPLYEDSELAYLKTHYYGGIRKYQWVTIPLELRGVVALKNGDTIDIAIGSGDEPKLFISDLLPHLGAEQNKKPLSEGIAGEQLNLLIGSRPLPVNEEQKDAVKFQVMKLLNEKYGFTEEDFISAELEAVPSMNAVDIGFDGSMIGAYGHDDRVCAYAAFKAMLDLQSIPDKTGVCILADKEEIGSVGVTGMETQAFETFIEDLCKCQNDSARICFENSFCLSADVTAAFDPNFADVFEKRNNAKLNYGVGLCKYTGSRGKGGASDASAETVAYVRRIFDENDVIWQMSEMGKVDSGGGGTVALFMANRNIDTIDAGVPVLSMHSPFEVVAKLDCYMTYKAMDAVYRG